MKECALIIAVLFATATASGQSLIVSKPWYESQIGPASISMTWQTSTPATTEAWIGLDSASATRQTLIESATTNHSCTFESLVPATTYYVKLVARTASVTDSTMFYTSTASAGSSGAMEVYFNRSIDSTTFPALRRPTGYNTDLLAQLHRRIQAAQHSIDLAVYSFSGYVGTTVADWLKEAVNRGVTVRFIADSASVRSSTAFESLASNGIPAITNGFGASKSLWSNIHHNKFIVFDGRESDAANAWTETGSWNLTDQQTTTDFQNIVYIQDLALARTYEREFNEEWGSDGDLPDALTSRFSTSKTNNTARSFNVGGKELHVLFSPNGGIADAIDSLLRNARQQIEFSMFTFTSRQLGQSLIAAHQSGIAVHGVVGAGGSSDQTSGLVSSGIDVFHFSDYLKSDTIFHHKYCIVDPNTSNATVITGSYNWSFSAETKNNENVLVIKDRSVSDMYFEEWLARYRENGGTAVIQLPLSGVSKTTVLSSISIGLTSNGVYLYGLTQPSTVTITDMLGRTIVSFSNVGVGRLPLALAPGMYLIHLSSALGRFSSKFLYR